jgi:hypothetical protein
MDVRYNDVSGLINDMPSKEARVMISMGTVVQVWTRSSNDDGFGHIQSFVPLRPVSNEC